MKVRIKFKKYGVMKFIGHLDIMRYFQKAIRRAEIPIAYSEGFSPHQVMSFAAPLGVGLESYGEYMDIELCTENISGEEIKTALNEVMAEGMEIVSVRSLPENAGNAMASVAAAEYSVRFREGYEPPFDWKKQLPIFFGQTVIMVTKKTKKSTIELDMKPGIFELEVKDDAIHMLVDASSAGNIKPFLLIEAFCAANGMKELNPCALMITREETYGNKGTKEAPVWAALLEFGEVF